MLGSLLTVLTHPLLSAPAPLPPLRVQGADLVDPRGRRVLLKGANVGNWQVIEFWMLALKDGPGKPGDQFDLESRLTKRFGEAEKDRLMDVYRSSWLTERDFKILPTFGFNVVRLPMNYRQFEDDRKPYQLRKDAWKWVDRAVNLAEQNGLYTILDMHGVQGGQSPYDHTGHSGQNHLKDDVENQKRLAWLWGEIAKRYRNRSAVVAYDVFNEPYGTPKPLQVSIFDRALKEIRKVDASKLVYAHGNTDGFDHYGDPKARGWKNVGFQMHYYPGLFGGGDPTIKTQVRHLNSLSRVAEKVKALNVPFLIGEMNVVFDAAGGAEMMRRTYDLHAQYGWATTMWSYKVLSDNGGIGNAFWGCVANAKPSPQVDFDRSSKGEIEAYFRSFATMPLTINEPLRRALSNPNFKPGPLPAAPVPRTVAPQGTLNGWTLTDIGGALKGGLEGSKDKFSLYGGGSDIWSTQDAFRYLHQSASNDVTLDITVDMIEDVSGYSKAGLMLRAGNEPDAPFVMLSSFPSGELQLAHRDAKGTEVTAPPTVKALMPGLKLRLIRKGGTITAQYSENGGPYQTLASVPNRLPAKVQAGVVACSHEADQLVKIDYRDLRLVSGVD